MSSISISTLVLGSLTVDVEGQCSSLSLAVLSTAPTILSMELGTPGAQGEPGQAATIEVGSTNTVPYGTPASVTNIGTANAANLVFNIPQGPVGQTGATGAAATIAAGTTTTLAPGSSATVTNVGTSGAAVFNFGIPAGQTGATGPGVAAGGDTGMMLVKLDATDYNTTWATAYAYQVRNTVRNETGAQLNKGTVIYINGAAGNKVTVAKAIATTDATSAQTFAVLAENIPNNQNGLAITSGLLEDFDTSAYAAGTQLYLSPTTAGAFTSTKPSAPNHMVYVGVIERSHKTQGSMLVRIQNGYELDETHDVMIAGKANNDVLAYDSATGLWKNKTAAAANLATKADPSLTGTASLTGTLQIDNASNATPALLINQTGTASALRINDIANDTTPFIVTETGAVGMGTANPVVKFQITEGNFDAFKYSSGFGGIYPFFGCSSNATETGKYIGMCATGDRSLINFDQTGFLSFVCGPKSIAWDGNNLTNFTSVAMTLRPTGLCIGGLNLTFGSALTVFGIADVTAPNLTDRSNKVITSEWAKSLWDYLVTSWSATPTASATTVPNGTVYEYTLSGTTRYRFVPTNYSPTQDAFYSGFSGGTLSGLICARG